MSIILDALKKSESDQQRQSGPALFEVKVAPPKARLPVWAIAIAALLVVNMIVVGYFLLRRSHHDSTDAANGQTFGASSTQPGQPYPSQGFGEAGDTGTNSNMGPNGTNAAGMSTNGGRPYGPQGGNGQAYSGDGERYSGAQQAAGNGQYPGNGQYSGGGQQSAGNGQYPGGDQQAAGNGQYPGGSQQAAGNGQYPGGSQQAAGNGQYPGGGQQHPSQGGNPAFANNGRPFNGQNGGASNVADSSAAGNMTGGAPSEPTLANRAHNGTDTENGPPPNPDDYQPATEPASNSLFKGHVKRGTEDGVPLYQDMAVVPGANLPELRLDLHVYAASAQDRFALINMRKMHEGDALQDGTRVESITPDGVIMSHNGAKFLLPRD
jgi:Type II secretion system protein B